MRTDLFVVSTSTRAFVSQQPEPAGDERFALCFLATTFPGFPFGNREEWERAFQRFFDGAKWSTEAEIRIELSEAGLSADEVDRQLRRARGLHKLFGQETTWERVTQVGFRNAHDQEVIRKTEMSGAVEHQRVYVMECGDCGHQYASEGRDIYNRRCHRCQDGPPGLPTEDLRQ